jgi:hypothetical protein
MTSRGRSGCHPCGRETVTGSSSKMVSRGSAANRVSPAQEMPTPQMFTIKSPTDALMRLLASDSTLEDQAHIALRCGQEQHTPVLRDRSTWSFRCSPNHCYASNGTQTFSI